MSASLRMAIVLTMLCMLLPLHAVAGGIGYSEGFIPQSPDGFSTISGQDFDISYGPESSMYVGEVADAASRAYAHVSKFFNGVPFRPTIIVVSSHEEYEKILDADSLPEYSVSSGWGDGGRSAIVIKEPDLFPNFETALEHEMTHVATRSYIKGYKYALPEWFSEGLAVYVSGDLPAAKIGVIEDKCRNGDLMSIEELERVHRLSATGDVSSEEVGQAYTQSGLLLKYIADRHGNESLLMILERFGPAADLDRAFLAVLGETPDQVNDEWQRGLKAELDRRDGKILEQAVYGYVVDHHGRPMPNETVSFIALRSDSPVQGTAYKAVTNDTGQYEVKVTYGPIRVISEKPGYEGFNETITLVRSQSLFMNITLNGSALEAEMARQKAEEGRRAMMYIGLASLSLATIVAAIAVLMHRK
ncbi:peptidase MA family metallohydrolase [Methanocella conradii]|uniref:peptidase MA family metallohydrolase n=1 Tax=Methanocella conradii TaxID=1175444 RepID=UPI0024B38B4D|nr:carboxypeptidase regulatory-like domain-containing protein [Methanocella conradii]MDI6897231.1 peptidase MA family metallohydrolase [Methanocella conradii]